MTMSHVCCMYVVVDILKLVTLTENLSILCLNVTDLKSFNKKKEAV